MKQFQPGDGDRWDAYVENTPSATFFHLSSWARIITEALGHKSHYLYAEQNGEIVGILPLAETKSRLFGHALISTPLCVYGGTVANGAAATSCLCDAAVKLAKQLRVDYVELRSRNSDNSEWLKKDLYVTFRKQLSKDHDANFKAIPRKQRAMVRKGRDANLIVSSTPTIEEFYRVYSESVRNLGTPVLSRRYYAMVKEVFGDQCEITVIKKDASPVAAVMSFYFRDEVHPYYGGSIWQGRQLRANDFMYWVVMKHAVERGIQLFDFGRSKRDTGSYHFKRHWGFEPQTLAYSYYLVNAKEMPNISPTNQKYQFLIRAWQHLPLNISQFIGPWIARNLG